MKRLWLILLYLLFSLIAFPAAAYADGTSPGGVVTIPDLWLTFIVASLLPILTGFLKARYSSSRVGALILLLLSVVSGWLTSLPATNGEFEPKTAAVSIAMTFVTAVGLHYGFLKPSGITGTGGVVQRVVPGGIGDTGRHRRRTAEN